MTKKPSHVLLFTLLLASISILLLGCSVIKDIYEKREAKVNPLIVSMDTSLYRAIDDPESAELIEVGTLVIRTGKCREGAAEENEMLCPIKTVHSDRRGWVADFTLLKFKDFLPADER